MRNVLGMMQKLHLAPESRSPEGRGTNAVRTGSSLRLRAFMTVPTARAAGLVPAAEGSTDTQARRSGSPEGTPMAGKIRHVRPWRIPKA